ncbi:MAG TPA: hypothetical protein VM734_33340 [Kofleriaceae bacterium]|jgi:hypothetical protein|nr:hypothetical protein [Kofleriaceae bacterium]
MVRLGAVASLLTLTLAVPAAFAQPDSGSEVELDEDPPASPGADGESGTEENPDAPRFGDDPVIEGPQAPRAKRTGYPVAEVARPITLPDFTSETRLELPIFPSGGIDAELGLRARYGITRQAQIGVRYAVGGFYDDPGDMSDKVEFNTGKAVGVDFQYLVTDWIAPRIVIPMYVDPFAIGMTLGAEMKFRIGDKLALVGFEDIVSFKLTDEFVPNLENERNNEVTVIGRRSDTIAPDGHLRFDFGAVYQATPELAITGRFGVTFVDFRDDDTPTSLRVQAQFTPKPSFDVIGRIGFEALDDSSSLNLGGAIQFRI